MSKNKLSPEVRKQLRALKSALKELGRTIKRAEVLMERQPRLFIVRHRQIKAEFAKLQKEIATFEGQR